MTGRDVYKRQSAYFYLNQACLSPNIHKARSAYQALYYSSQEEKEYKKAVEYLSLIHI